MECLPLKLLKAIHPDAYEGLREARSSTTEFPQIGQCLDEFFAIKERLEKDNFHGDKEDDLLNCIEDNKHIDLTARNCQEAMLSAELYCMHEHQKDETPYDY